MTEQEFVALPPREQDAVAWFQEVANESQACRTIMRLSQKPYACRACGSKVFKWYGRKSPMRYCVACHKKSGKKWFLANQDIQAERNKRWYQTRAGKRYMRKVHLEKRFGIGAKEYDAMYESQSGRCALCGNTETENGERLSVDHCHQDGVIRGLLCRHCNLWMRRVAASVNFLNRAVDYLSSPPAVAVLGVVLVPPTNRSSPRCERKGVIE